MDQCPTLSFISESLCQTFRAKRQRIDVSLSGVVGMERRENEGFAWIVPSRQIRPDDLVDGVCASKHYRVYGPVNSASRDVAPSPRYWAGGSGSVKPAPDSHVDRVEPIRIDSRAQTSPPRPDGRTRGAKNRSWLDPFWPCRRSPARSGQGSRVALHRRMRHQHFTMQILGKWGDSTETTSQGGRWTVWNHFVSTHSRTAGDRYIVRLPFKAGPPIAIGDSLQIATALHTRIKGRLQSRPEISQQYYEFLREYLELSHMESVTEGVTTPFQPVYIPHYAVIRESSSTTKLSVVFNVS